MDPNLRRAWTDIVDGRELDAHMAATGQAQANAELLAPLLNSADVPPGGRVAFVGAGTGQFFDLMNTTPLVGRQLVLTDINERFLAQLRERLARHPELSGGGVFLDDVEATRLVGPFDAVVVVLVLEHVEWRKALTALAATKPVWLLIILQRNEASQSVVTLERELLPSIRAASEVAHPELVAEEALTGWLAELGFRKALQVERAVEDAKTMLGLAFRRVPNHEG